MTGSQDLQLEIDANYAVEIAPDVYWVGFYDEHEKLHCNPYLIRHNGDSILIDPGSVPDFPVVARKVFSIIPVESISTFILQHQDPDLCASVPIFEDLKGNLNHDVISVSATAYFVHHYGVKGNLVRLDLPAGRALDYTTPGGRELSFIWTPYAHSFGAMMTYDKASGVLFSSDILGGLGVEWELYHNEQALLNMKSFMQLIMPTNRILRYSLRLIQSFGAKLICPQHGQIIHAKDLPAIVDALWDLPCGLDRIEDSVLREI
jgi:flavorubredoxin